MTIVSSKNTPRIAYTATANQQAFTIPFEFFAVADVKVYNGTTLLTYDANADAVNEYSITGTASDSDESYEFGAGGTVNIGATGISAGAIITIIRDIAIERASDFPSSGSFDMKSLNTDLDKVYAKLADLDQHIDRSVKLLDTDSISATTSLPAKATRASKVMTFDSDGNVATTFTAVDTSTVAGIASDVTTVAGISSNVTTVAGISSNVTSVAGVSANVTTVAGISSNVTTVAGISSNVTSVAGIASNVTTVANNISSVNNFEAIYRIGSSDPTSSLDEGDLFYNSTDNNLKFYNGSAWTSIDTGLTDIVGDASPQLGGNLDVQAREINTSTTNGNIILTPNGTGMLEVKGNTNAGTIQLNCENNSHGIKIKGPPHSAGQSYTLTLPSSITSDYYLKTDGSGNLSFAEVPTETKPTVADVSQTIAPASATTINITGTNFVTVPIVEFIKTDGAITRPNSVSFTNATTLSVNVTLATGAYHVRVENPDGNAGRSTNNILTASTAPTFSTAAGSLGSVNAGDSVSIDVDGSSDSTVAFSETTSVLTSNANTPAATMNLSLNSSTGVISGTAPSPTSETTYNFTLRLTDAESQTVDRAFSITISVGMNNSGQFN
ncbi:phage+glycanotransferase [uncultured Mediterranean phage uvMED]|nr:phage+glycanotransferase [uncultured Mediterranean phage uvMED]